MTFLRSHQIRLCFSSLAYRLPPPLPRRSLQGTELARVQCATRRLKLLKIGALVQVTVRQV